MRLLLLCLALGAAAPAVAQTSAAPEPAPESLPTWVVPVLRLVSETHVEPTTGIVLSRSGWVLVPGDFAAIGDEIVVLDGGNDIVRHGRPAQPHAAYPELGLKVLSVPGLSRAGAPVAAEFPGDGEAVRLRAFPPAEQIAEGAAPLRQPATLSLAGEGGSPSITTATPLANVTGALLDGCGNLIGVSLAGGVQTMAPSADTRYIWLGALRQVLEALQLPTAGVPCPAAAAGETAFAPPGPPAADGDQPPESEPDTEPDTESRPETESEAAANAESAEAAAAQDETPELPSPPEPEAAEPSAEAAAPAGDGPAARHWWWLAGGLVLLGAGLAVRRLRRDSEPGAAAPAAENDGGAGETVPPGPGSGDLPSARQEPRLDSRLILTGRYADGRAFEVSAPVSADAINLEIGRGGADLALDSVAVSRRHARLNGSRNELTLADLGSRNGTSIDGVPCLEGEIMYLESGSAVVLGDVRFTVSVKAEPDRS